MHLPTEDERVYVRMGCDAWYLREEVRGSGEVISGCFTFTSLKVLIRCAFSGKNSFSKSSHLLGERQSCVLKETPSLESVVEPFVFP